MTKLENGRTLEEIKCYNCNQTNIINPKIVHAEDGSPFALHCTYCKADIESNEILYDKVEIRTNTAFLLNQFFNRLGTVEGNSLDQKLFKWVNRQHAKSWSKDADKKKHFVKVTMELIE